MPHRPVGRRHPDADDTIEVEPTMNRHSSRLMAVTGATLALVVAGTAAVSAHPGHDDRGFRGDRLRDRVESMRDARGERGALRAALRGDLEDFERREVITQTADGTDARRIEQGVVDSVGDASLDFTLGSGEAVSVTIDDETGIVAVTEQTIERRFRTRDRLVPERVELEDVAAGDSIMVWSMSEDGGDFIAQRIVIQPVDDEADAAAAETGSAAEADAAEAETGSSATTDA
jgi:hypothetical protein